jgi:hypothetical protein
MEIFPVYGGKFLSCKAFHSWVEKRGKYFADGEEVETEVQKWLRQQSEGFSAAGFDPLVLQCWWRICRNICFFQVRISHVLHFILIRCLFNDSASYYRRRYYAVVMTVP